MHIPTHQSCVFLFFPVLVVIFGLGVGVGVDFNTD